MLVTRNLVVLLGCLFGLLGPIVVGIVYKVKTKCRILPMIVGAICFFVFASILEGLLHQYCLMSDNVISRTITSSAVLYVLYGAFAAGIFEETARLFGFKVLLRKNNDKSQAIGYGIGHGGIEVILVLGVNYLIYLLSICGVDMGGQEVNNQLIGIAQSIGFSTVVLAIVERTSAMLLHIGLSIFVFIGVKRNKFYLYPLAIILHVLADVPAALYQVTGSPSIMIIEIIAFIMGLIIFIIGKKLLKNVD